MRVSRNLSPYQGLLIMKCFRGIAVGWKAIFPAGTTVGDSRHRKSPTHREKIWTWAEPEFRLCPMKLCSSDNYYTTVPYLTQKIFLGGDISLKARSRSRSDRKTHLKGVRGTVTRFDYCRIQVGWKISKTTA